MNTRARRLVLASVLVGCGCGSEHPPGLVNLDAGPLGLNVPDVEGASDARLTRAASGYPAYDLTLTLPFNGPEQTFDLAAEPRATKLDVHLNIDTTGSFSGEIANLKTALGVNIIPALRARVGDLAMGVSRFGEFPVAPFGNPSDQPYNLLTAVTTDLPRVSLAVNSLNQPLQNGGDAPEPWGEALYQIATGEGLSLPVGSIPRYTAASGTFGGVGFRAGAARVVINVTDAPSHEPGDYGDAVPGTHSTDQAATALQALGVRMIGIASGDEARAQMETIAIRTGAVAPATSGRCSTGINGGTRAAVGGMCPLVFDISNTGSGLGTVLVDGILRFLDSLAFAQVNGHPTDDEHGFVRAIEAVSATVADGATPPQRADLAPAGMPDGVLDTFVTVPTRSQLTFRAHLRNVTMRESEYPQLYFIHVLLVGDGVTVDERVVRVIVPEGPKPDAGDGSVDAVVPDDLATATDTGTDVGTDTWTDSGTDAGVSSDATATDESIDAGVTAR